MSEITDPDYLLNNQYRDADKLQARINLHRRFSTNHEPWQRWVFDHFQFAGQARVLELGCGPGDLWVDNAARVPADWRVILSDFSPGMLAEAVRSLERLSCPLWFALVDAQAIPFPASSFQAVIANHMLYHTSDRAKAFAEIHRVLLPEGFLYATTVGAQHMNQLHDLVRRFDPAAARQFPADVNLFTLENGSEQLAPWFPEVEVHQQDSDLIVTEVKPLVDYILSSVRLGADEEARPELTGFIRREMVQNGGAIRINKANGIFIARKAGNNTSGYPT